MPHLGKQAIYRALLHTQVDKSKITSIKRVPTVPINISSMSKDRLLIDQTGRLLKSDSKGRIFDFSTNELVEGILKKTDMISKCLKETVTTGDIGMSIGVEDIDQDDDKDEDEDGD